MKEQKDTRQDLKRFLEEESIIPYKKLQNMGFSSSQIKLMLKQGFLTRVERGVYSLFNTPPDPYQEFQLKYTQAIFSNETALSLHQLTDVMPEQLSITVSQSYNADYLKKKSGVSVRKVSPARYALGMTVMKSPFGNEIRVYDREKTLCDILSKRFHVEKRLIVESFKNYLESKDKNLSRLLEYARQLRVENEVRKYLEILT